MWVGLRASSRGRDEGIALGRLGSVAASLLPRRYHRRRFTRSSFPLFASFGTTAPHHHINHININIIIIIALFLHRIYTMILMYLPRITSNHDDFLSRRRGCLSPPIHENTPHYRQPFLHAHHEVTHRHEQQLVTPTFIVMK